MAITINGTGTITGISAGGLPDNCVTAADLATTLDLSSNTVTLPSGTGGKVLQAVYHTTTNQLDGSLGGVNSSDSAGSTDGTELTSFNFTPQSSSSKIVLISSNISISENVNSNNAMYVGAFAGTSRITVVNTAVWYGAWSSNYNSGFLNVSSSIDSWGTTQRTISIRAGACASTTGGSMTVNKDYSHNSETAGERDVNFIMLEIA